MPKDPTYSVDFSKSLNKDEEYNPKVSPNKLMQWNKFLAEKLNPSIAKDKVTDEMLDSDTPFTIKGVRYNTGKEYTDKLLSDYIGEQSWRGSDNLSLNDIPAIQEDFNNIITSAESLPEDAKANYKGTYLKYPIEDLGLDVNKLSTVEGRIGSITRKYHFPVNKQTGGVKGPEMNDVFTFYPANFGLQKGFAIDENKQTIAPASFGKNYIVPTKTKRVNGIDIPLYTGNIPDYIQYTGFENGGKTDGKVKYEDGGKLSAEEEAKQKQNEPKTHSTLERHEKKIIEPKTHSTLERHEKKIIQEMEAGGKTKGKGNFEEISEENVKIEGPSHEEGGVELSNGDEVRGEETMNVDKGMVFSASLVNPDTGNPFAKDHEELAKVMKELEGRKEGWAVRKLGVLKEKEHELFEKQQELNGHNGEGEEEVEMEDGGLTDGDPPVKAKSKVPQIRYFVANGESYEVNPKKYDQFIKDFPDAKEYVKKSDNTFVEATSTLATAGQKKNGPLSKAATTTKTATTTAPTEFRADWDVVKDLLPQEQKDAVTTVKTEDQLNGLDIQEHKDLYKEIIPIVEKVGANKFIEPLIGEQQKEIIGTNNPFAKITTFGVFNDIIKDQIKANYDPETQKILDEYGPEMERVLQGAARIIRDEQNSIIGNKVMEELFKDEQGILQYEKGRDKLGQIVPGNIETSKGFDISFEDLVSKYKGIKITGENGKVIDTDNVTPSQLKEIEAYVRNSYQTYRNIQLESDRLNKTVEAISTGKNEFMTGSYDENGLYIGEKMVKVDEQNPLYVQAKDAIANGIIPKDKDFWKGFLSKTNTVNEKYTKIYNDLQTSIDIDSEASKLALQKEEAEFINNTAIPMLEKAQVEIQAQIDKGEISLEDGTLLLDQTESAIKQQQTGIYDKWSKKINADIQQKIALTNEAYNTELKGLFTNSVYESLDISKVDEEYINKSLSAFYGIVGEQVDKNLGSQYVQLNKIANDAYQLQPDWTIGGVTLTNTGKITTEFGRGILQMGESLGGMVSFLGGYELGNILTDTYREYNADNPQLNTGDIKVADFLNPDFYIANMVPSMPMAIAFTGMGLVTGGAAGGIATDLGISGLGKTVFQGVAGSFMETPLMAISEAGSDFNQQLADGKPIEVAAQNAADTFAGNMSLWYMNVGQLMMAYTPLGKIKGVKSALLKAPGGVITEGGEEVYQGYLTQHNPYQSLLDYAFSPMGKKEFVVGGVMGLAFSAPDIASTIAGKENKWTEALTYDMLMAGDMQTEYKRIKQGLDLMVARNQMAPEKYDQAMQQLEFALLKGREIPANLKPEQKHNIFSLLSDINTIEGVKAKTTDPTLIKTYDKEIGALEKQVQETMAGTQPMYFIGRVSYTKEQFDQQMEIPEVVNQILNGETTVGVYNDEATLTKIQELYDPKNSEGVQGGIQDGEEPITNELDKGAGGEEISTGGVVQDEEIVINTEDINENVDPETKDGVPEDYPPSELTPEEEVTEEERYNKELDEFDSFLKQQAPDLELTREQLDELNGSFYIDEDGTIRNYDGDETTIEDVIEKGKELKEGTIGESDDGKIRFVKEGDRIIMRDAQGNEILPQTRSSEVVTIENYDRLLKDWKESGRKKGEPMIGKKYFSKREADEGVRLVDLKTYKKYEAQLQKLDAVKGEPINSQDPREIADKSNDPDQVKWAYEEEKSRLREIESTTSGVGGNKDDIIYELVKGGISEGDAKILDLDDRDGSISVLGWKIYDTGKGDIDTVIDAFNNEYNADISLNDVKEFIVKYKGGPHQYKSKREQTLKDLEDRYKELTGFGINTKEVTKVESKTKAEPKVEEKVELEIEKIEPETKVSVSEEEKIAPEQIKKEVEEKKVVEDAIDKAAKELADKLKSKLSIKTRTIKFKDENGNEIESNITSLGIGAEEWNKLIEVFANAFASAVVKGQKYKIAIKATVEYLRGLDSFKALNEAEQEAIEQDLKQFLKENSGVKFKKPEKKEGISQARQKIASASENVSEEVKSKFNLGYLKDSIKNMTKTASDIWEDIKEQVEKNGGTREDAIREAEKAIMDLNVKMRISQRGALSLMIAKQLHQLRGKEGVTLDEIADYDYRANNLLNSVADILTDSAQTLATLGKFMTDYLMAYPENIIEVAKDTIDKINDKKAPISDENVMSLTEMVNEILTNPEGVAQLEAQGFGKKNEKITKKYTNKKAAVKSGYDKFLSDFDDSYKGMMLSSPISPALFKAGVKAMAEAHMKLLDMAQAVELAIAKIKELNQGPIDEAKERAKLEFIYKKIDAESLEILESQNKDKIAAFGRLFSQPIPKEKGQVKSKQDKMNELAKQLDETFGTNEYSKLVQEYEGIKQEQNQKKIDEKLAKAEEKLNQKLAKIAEREKAREEAKAKNKEELAERLKQKLAEQLEKKKQKEAEKQAAYEAKLKEYQDKKTAKFGEKQRIKEAMESMKEALAELDKAQKERRKFEENLKNLTGKKLLKFAEKITQDYLSGRTNLTPSDIKRAYQQSNGGIALTQKEEQIIDKNANIITQGLTALKSGTLNPVQIRLLNNQMAHASTKISDILNPRRWRDVVEATIIGNYFSIPTILANAVSNAIKKVYERTGGILLNVVDVLFEPGMTELRSGTYIDRVKARFNEKYGKKSVAASIAQLEMLVPALKMAGTAMREGGVSSDELGKIGAKYQLKSIEAWKDLANTVSKQTTTFNKFNEGAKVVYEGTAGVFPAFFLRSLVAGDIASRVPEQAKIEQQIANMLGIPVEVLLTDDAYADWRETAKELSKFSVFQQNNVISWLYGKATAPAETAWGEFRKWAALLAMMPIAPFKGTPVNITYELMKFIPLVQTPELIYRISQANNKNLTAAERYKNSRRAQADMKKLVASVPMYFAVSALLKAGVLIVGYELPDDEKERAYKRQNLGSPLRLTINMAGLEQYSFDAQRLGPIFSYITLVDSFNKSWKESGGDPIQATEELLGTMKKAVLEQTFLTGINNLVKALESDTRLRGLLIDTYGNAYFNALMPATFTGITKMMDDDKYLRVMKNESFWKEVYNKTIRKRLGFLNIPGAKMEELKPQYNLWGKTQKTDSNGQMDIIHYLFDFTRSEDMGDFATGNRTNEIILKKYLDTKDSDWIPPMAPRDESFVKGGYKYTDSEGKDIEGQYEEIGRVKLTPNLRNEYQRILGEQSQYEIDELGVSENTSVESIKEAYDKAQKRAKKIFYNENKEALTKLIPK